MTLTYQAFTSLNKIDDDFAADGADVSTNLLHSNLLTQHINSSTDMIHTITPSLLNLIITPSSSKL